MICSWYKANINESTILDFAQNIHDNGFAVSQIEIDDNWEVCYGDAVFDTSSNKFPDPKKLISTIKEEFGYRVTLWVHPFVNVECSSWNSVAVPPKSYFVRDKKGKTGIPLIDAAMRQIYDNGWMHNRLRMVVGSFLVKNLLLN